MASKGILKRALFLAAVGSLYGSTASAGMFGKGFDFFHIVPFIGAEYVHVSGANVNTAGGNIAVTTSDVSGTSLAYGFLAGARLGPIGLGLLYQRSSLEFAQNVNYDLNKLYGELGFYSFWGPVCLVVHFDFGYSFIQRPVLDTLNGFGGKLGLALDYYITPMISAGVDASFDAQGYKTENDYVGAYGGTFLARAGLHF